MLNRSQSPLIIPAGGFLKFQFSSGAFHETERATVLEHALSSRFARYRVESLAVPFSFETTIWTAPLLTIMSLKHAKLRLKRDPDLLNDEDDSLVMLIAASGCHLKRQPQSSSVGHGEAVLLSNSKVASLSFDTDSSDDYFLRFSRRMFTPLVRDIENTETSIVLSNSRELIALSRYLASFSVMRAINSSTANETVSFIYDLAASVFGTARDTREFIKRRGARAGQFVAIKAYIVSHITNENLSADSVGKVHGITAAHVRKIFAQNKNTFTSFVLNHRLARVHEALCDPRVANWPIEALAKGSGFNSMSYFSRSFLRRYGKNPSRVRADAAEKNCAWIEPFI